MLLRVVRADRDEVRPLHHRVPLRPRLDQVALPVEDQDVVLPARVHAELVARFQPRLDAFFRNRAGAAVARQARRRRVAPRQAADREHDARPDPLVPRPLDRRQLAALQHEHAVRVLREHALAGAERPALVARQRRQVLRPALLRHVRPPDVLAALLTRNGGEPRLRTGLRRHAVAVHQIPHGDARQGHKHHRQPFTHNRFTPVRKGCTQGRKKQARRSRAEARRSKAGEAAGIITGCSRGSLTIGPSGGRL